MGRFSKSNSELGKINKRKVAARQPGALGGCWSPPPAALRGAASRHAPPLIAPALPSANGGGGGGGRLAPGGIAVSLKWARFVSPGPVGSSGGGYGAG